jgi:hypothetical protein
MDAALKASTATRRTKAGPIPGHSTPWLDRAENIEDFHRAINACRRYKVAALAADKGPAERPAEGYLASSAHLPALLRPQAE